MCIRSPRLTLQILLCRRTLVSKKAEQTSSRQCLGFGFSNTGKRTNYSFLVGAQAIIVTNMSITKVAEMEESAESIEVVEDATSATVLHESVLHELQFDTTRREIPTLNPKDIEFRSKLGSGSFSDVFSVSILLGSWVNCSNSADPTEEASSSDSDHAFESKRVFHTTCSTISRSSHLPNKSQYAIKTLRKDFSAKEKGIVPLAVRDAYFEVEILSHLPPHPHIVNLLAMSNAYLDDPAKGFLILERLLETLKHRLTRWSRNSKNTKKASYFQFVKRRREMIHDQRSRIESCGVGLARAFRFLHKHGIVYRDLKPANVGFSHDGTVKLFDFGLSRRHVPLKDRHQLRRMTGDVGTARYMAPEVSLHEDYSLPADVHSYAIQLWEICTLEKPYEGCSSLDQLKQRAVRSNIRPSLRKIACSKVRALLRACWDPEPRARPTFASILMEVELAAGLAAPVKGS